MTSSYLSCDWSVTGRSETDFRESNVTKLMTLSTKLFSLLFEFSFGYSDDSYGSRATQGTILIPDYLHPFLKI